MAPHARAGCWELIADRPRLGGTGFIRAAIVVEAWISHGTAARDMCYLG